MLAAVALAASVALGQYIDAVYAERLGRPPSAEEHERGIDEVEQGGRYLFVATLPYRSNGGFPDEGSRHEARLLFEAALGRTPEPDAEAFFAGRLGGFEGRLAVTAYLWASDEARAAQPDLGAWVDDLYLDLLGRPADAAGRSFWIDAAQRDPFDATAELLRSDEARRAEIDRLYRRVLDRPAEPEAIDHWFHATDHDLLVELLARDEYLALVT